MKSEAAQVVCYIKIDGTAYRWEDLTEKEKKEYSRRFHEQGLISLGYVKADKK